MTPAERAAVVLLLEIARMALDGLIAAPLFFSKDTKVKALYQRDRVTAAIAALDAERKTP